MYCYCTHIIYTLEAFGNSLVFVILKDFCREISQSFIFKKFLGKQVLNSLDLSLPTSRLAGSKAHCSASPGAEAGLPVKVAEKTPQGYRIVILEDFLLMLQPCVMI